MSVYIITWIVLFLLFILEVSNHREEVRKRYFYIGAFVVFFIIAFRSEFVGGDTENYCRFFDGKPSMYGTYKELDDAISYEVGFLWTVRLIRCFGESHFVFIFLSALLSLLPFYMIIKRDCKVRILPLCLFMLLFGILTIAESAFRQNYGVAYLFIAYYIFTSDIRSKNKKYGLSMFFLVIACLCHITIFIAFVLMLGCYFLRIKKWISVTLILASVAVSVGINNVFGTAFGASGEAMSNFEIFVRLQNYYETGQYELDEERVSIFRLLPTSLFVCFILWRNDDRKLRPIPFNSLVVGTCIYNLGISFPMMFRVVYPLLLLGITVSPGDLRLARNKVQKLIIMLCVLVFMERQLEHLIEYDYSKNEAKMLPYTFIFE